MVVVKECWQEKIVIMKCLKELAQSFFRKLVDDDCEFSSFLDPNLEIRERFFCGK